MSLALREWNSTLISLRAMMRQQPAWHVFRPAAALWTPFYVGFPSLTSLLELLPPIMWAVPKKKVSHSRKAMRDSNKGLKDKTNIVNCPGCGGAKLAHHLCPNCYSQISRGFKREARERVAAEQAGITHSNVKPNKSVKDIVTTGE